MIEEILIKDEVTFYDTIIYTHYGPITYDRNFLEDSININFVIRYPEITKKISTPKKPPEIKFSPIKENFA